MRLNKHAYDVLSLCSGLVDFENFLIPDEFRESAEKLVKEGLIEICGQDKTIKPYQRYHLYPNKYIKTAHWSITGQCNYKCRHCYMSAPDAKYGEFSYEQCLDIIDQLYDCGVMNVSITGGEALVRSDFFALLDRMLAYGLNITTVYSNGKLITADLLDKFERRRIYPEFNLSFDGVGWHDWLRGVAGAEEAVLNAFKICRERGFPTGAEMCLHQRNKHTLRESINLMASLGVRSVKTNPAGLSGAWVENAGNDNLEMRELFDVYLDYVPHYFEDGSPMSVHLGGFFWSRKGTSSYRLPFVKSDGSEKAGRYNICEHARNTLYIAADGRALPCMSLSGMEIQKEFPLITEIGLRQCLTDSTYMKLIETSVDEYLARNEDCAACEYRYFCAGGCRASALTTCNDIMGKDGSVCALLRGGWAERIAQAAKGYTCENY